MNCQVEPHLYPQCDVWRKGRIRYLCKNRWPLHSCSTSNSFAPPFHFRFRNFSAVLLVCLQLAPIATMHCDNASVPCKRCSSSPPDTLEHWLFHCPLFWRQRKDMTKNFTAWGDILDNAIAVRTLTPQQGYLHTPGENFIITRISLGPCCHSFLTATTSQHLLQQIDSNK